MRLVDKHTVTTGGDGHPIGRIEHIETADDRERVMHLDDELTPELAAIATTNTTVQDVKGAWLKFCGHYDGKRINVAGKWQQWCVREAVDERTARHREQERQARRGGPERPFGTDDPPKPKAIAPARLRQLVPGLYDDGTSENSK